MPKHLNNADDFEMVAIERLKPHPNNVNEADTGAVIESIKAHGFYGALVVQRGTCHVVAGNHRLLAAKTLGFSELPVTWITCTDEMAIRLMLTDNRSTRLGRDNPAALAELLTELAGTETGLVGLGFDGDDLDSLINDLSRPNDGDWGETLGGLPDGDKAPFQQMTFTLHDSQVDTINAALDQAKKRGDFAGSLNENSNGNALTRLCETFIHG